MFNNIVHDLQLYRQLYIKAKKNRADGSYLEMISNMIFIFRLLVEQEIGDTK